MRKILLDTNAYSAYRLGNERVLEFLAEADRVYLSVFVLAELLYGFKGGRKEERNRGELKKFLRKPTVRHAQPTQETAEFFSDVKNSLREKGKPIPTNDVWIAAHSFELGAALVSADVHFKHVDGLRVRHF